MTYDGFNPADEELGPEPEPEQNHRHLLVALENELLSPEHQSIVEMINVKREAMQEITEHREMVGLMTTTGHRQRAVAVIIDRMPYLELIDLVENLFDGQRSIEAAAAPAQLARWARRAKA